MQSILLNKSVGLGLGELHSSIEARLTLLRLIVIGGACVQRVFIEQPYDIEMKENTWLWDQNPDIPLDDFYLFGGYDIDGGKAKWQAITEVIPIDVKQTEYNKLESRVKNAKDTKTGLSLLEDNLNTRDSFIVDRIKTLHKGMKRGDVILYGARHFELNRPESLSNRLKIESYIFPSKKWIKQKME